MLSSEVLHSCIRVFFNCLNLMTVHFYHSSWRILIIRKIIRLNLKYSSYAQISSNRLVVLSYFERKFTWYVKSRLLSILLWRWYPKTCALRSSNFARILCSFLGVQPIDCLSVYNWYLYQDRDTQELLFLEDNLYMQSPCNWYIPIIFSACFPVHVSDVNENQESTSLSDSWHTSIEAKNFVNKPWSISLDGWCKFVNLFWQSVLATS